MVVETLALRREETRVSIQTGRDTLIKMSRPVANIYRLDHYYPGQQSFLPRVISAKSRGVLDSLDVVADFLVGVHQRENWTAMVLGHADSSGSSSKNREITTGRVASLHAFVTDDRDAWIAGFDADDNTVATRVFFAWVATRFGWDVETGPDPGWSSRCEDALNTYRREANERLGTPSSSSKSMTREDWGAAFDLMNDGLVSSLRGDSEALAKLRGAIQVSSAHRLSCGDSFPLDSSGDAEAARRVELVLLEDQRALSEDPMQAAGLYDRAWVRRRVMEHEPRVELRLGIRADDGFPIPGVPFALEIDGFTTQGKSTHEGTMLSPRVPASEFVVDLHDPQVLAAHDLAKRIHASIDRAEPAGVVPPLSEGAALAELVAHSYATLFGKALVDDIVELGAGSDIEDLLHALLAKCGLRPDPRFVFHRFGKRRDK